MKRHGCARILIGLPFLAVAWLVMTSMLKGEGFDTWPMMVGCGAFGGFMLLDGIGLLERPGKGIASARKYGLGGELDDLSHLNGLDTREGMAIERWGGYLYRDEYGNVVSDQRGAYPVYEGYILGQHGETYPDGMVVLLPDAQGDYHIPAVLGMGEVIISSEFVESQTRESWA
jgi:hypothetical protein